MADEPDQGALSLKQVSHDFWGDAPADASRFIRTAHELRRKPVNALTAEDLRLLISQEIGVEVLVPLAVALLRRNPLVEGDYYPGDLLVAVMKLPSAYGTLTAMSSTQSMRSCDRWRTPTVNYKTTSTASCPEQDISPEISALQGRWQLALNMEFRPGIRRRTMG
jgi:CDI immunity proteins